MKLVIAACLICLFGSLAKAEISAQAKNEKWDQLDDLLKKADEIVKNLEGDEDEEDDEALDHQETTEAQTTNVPTHGDGVKHPCEDKKCSWGKECIVTASNKAVCRCAKACPKPETPQLNDKVCSSQNETFDSICDLYRERCLCKHDMPGCQSSQHRHAHLEYLGQCKSLDVCTEELMEQFPVRMADWLFEVMRELNRREELHGDNWMEMLEQAESNAQLKHVYPIIWKFCDLDQKPHDAFVSPHELIPVTAPVMPMESCIKPFLRSCDTNDDDKITLQEWGKCLGLKEGEIVERC